MSFRQSPSCRVPSPSSSPPVSFVCTPPNGSSESKLLPSPPLSASSRRSESKDLVWCALEYIHNRTSESPRLLLPNFSWAHFDDFQDELNYPRRLFGKSADSLRFDYNPETLTLRIPPMPKAAHNEFEDFFTKSMIRISRNVITEAELDQLHFGFGTDHNLPFHATTPHLGRKATAFAKQPDAFIGLNDDGTILFPRVVFEVGFSQSYAEVLDDVHQWLVRSEGRILVAVLIYIEEHEIAAPPDGEVDDQHSDDSEASNVAMYERLRDSCDVDRYVGPLSGFAELYRLGPAGVYRDGGRINVISPPNAVPSAPAGHIQLSITDLLPHVVDDRVIDFDLARYACGLQKSRGHMALPRILEERRRRQRAASRIQAVDADNQPGAAAGGNRRAV